MSYEKTTWKNRLVERPRTFRLQQNADGSVTLIPAEGNIIEAGTPVNAGNLNKIEQGIEDAHNMIAAHSAEFTQLQEEVGTEELPTEAKTIKGAIAEVFTNGNNVKSNTVGALLSVDDSLPITSDSSWVDIISSIGQISTGKKWAKGTADLRFSGNISVRSLDFRPSIVIARDRTAPENMKFSLYWGALNINVRVNNTNTVEAGSATIYDNGFDIYLYIHNSGNYHEWIAFE